MTRQKPSLTRKILSVFVAIIFGVFSFSQSAFGQMDPSSGGIVDTGVSKVIIVTEDVTQALPMPGNVTVNFKDVEIKTVLHYLSEVSGVDIVPAPGVEANVTMRLRDKPWETALDIVTRNYGFVYSREGDIIRVIPKGQLSTEETITEVIPLDNLMREIELTRNELEADDVVVKAKYGEDLGPEAKEESIDQLLSAVNAILDRGRGESAIFIASANAIIVTAIPSRIGQVKTMIDSIDKRSAQIVLDVKVVEITLNEDERFGVDWNAVMSVAGAKRPITFPFTNTGVFPWLPGTGQRAFYPSSGAAVESRSDFPFFTNPAISPVGAPTGSDTYFTFGTLDFSTFTATLSFIERQENAEILASPRITTLNNQKATVKVIDKIMFQKSIESTETGRTMTVEFEKESEAREVGVKLIIVPHVNDEGDITVNLFPEVSENRGFNILDIDAAITTYSLTFSSREANTMIRVKDGETIFLGGLIQEDVTTEDNKLPIIGDLLGGIPILGNAFRYEEEVVIRTEIAFFVTVHLVKDGMDSIQKMAEVPKYEKFVVPDKQKGAEYVNKNTGTRVPAFKTGKLKETEKQIEITAPLSGDAGGKKRKPFLDFRKKKKEE